MNKPKKNTNTKPEIVENHDTTKTDNNNVENKREEKEREVTPMNKEKTTTENTTETTENPYQKYIDMVHKLLTECGLKYEYKANQNRHFYYNPDLMKSVQRQFMVTYSKRGVRIATREEYNTLYEGKICHYNLPLAIATDYSNLYKVVTHLRKGYKETMKALEKEKKEREKEEKKEKETA